MVVSPPMNDESDVIFRDMLLWHSQTYPEVRPKASDWLLGDAHGNESPQSELDISRWPLFIGVDDRFFRRCFDTRHHVGNLSNRTQ